jgi:hypothetical protein
MIFGLAIVELIMGIISEIFSRRLAYAIGKRIPSQLFACHMTAPIISTCNKMKLGRSLPEILV